MTDGLVTERMAAIARLVALHGSAGAARMSGLSVRTVRSVMAKVYDRLTVATADAAVRALDGRPDLVEDAVAALRARSRDASYQAPRETYRCPSRGWSGDRISHAWAHMAVGCARWGRSGVAR